MVSQRVGLRRRQQALILLQDQLARPCVVNNQRPSGCRLVRVLALWLCLSLKRRMLWVIVCDEHIREIIALHASPLPLLRPTGRADTGCVASFETPYKTVPMRLGRR